MNLDLDFNAQVDDSDISGINALLGVSNDIDIDTGKPTFYIKYSLEPEAREWGIKSISMCVKAITATIEWEVESSDLKASEKATLIKAGGTEYRNDTIGGEIYINSNIYVNGNDWKVESETSFADDGAFSIENISVDLSDLSITVS